MPETKNQNSPWKGENFFPIAKMGIEGTVAVASLAAAITTIFVATGTIAGPAFLAFVANPVGIAALFVAAVYFAVAAYTSYKQLYKNEEISGAVAKAKGAQREAKRAEAQASNFVTQDHLNIELGKTLDSDKFNEKVKETLPTLLTDPEVATSKVKVAM